MELVELALEGPYHLRSPEGAIAFDPPSKRGVFLWTIRAGDRYRIAWVGQARDIRRVLWREIVSLLGGGRAIYPAADLTAAVGVPTPVYSGKRKDFVNAYMNDRESLSALAHQNLMTYDFFWARVQGKRKGREAVESAIIARAKELGGPIQNVEPSRAHDKTERTIVRPILPAGTRIDGMEEEIRYGVRLLPQDRPIQVRPEDYQT
jgi:hypothetical protein